MTVREFYDLCVRCGTENFELYNVDRGGHQMLVKPESVWMNYLPEAVAIIQEEEKLD